MKHLCTKLTVLFFMFTSFAYAQKATSNTSEEEAYISKQLSTTIEVAKKTMQEMVLYKNSAKKITDNPYFTSELIKFKLDSLTALKNKKLSMILTPKQFEIFVPTTERDKK